MSGAKNVVVVCVTGASGYIASWLVKLLLQRGYIVKATVRDLNNPKKTEHLLSLDGAKQRLHLFKADLLEEGSFDPVVDGCDGVFHTASPVVFSSISDPKAELIDPAVKGTLNVLQSCKKFPTVRRVILTSSMASVIMNGKPLTPDVVVDETWYSDPLLAEKHKLWYLLSKTLAEQAAWKFAEGNGIDLVSINPGFVIGPLLQPEINLTVEMIQNLITGKAVTASSYRFIDVRDVASAHIQAFEVPSATGRYCLASHAAKNSETLEIIRQLYPTLHIFERCEDENRSYLPSDPEYQVSKEKAKGLGISFYPFEVTLKDTLESLKEKGFLNV
ncbi:phenylacetaldehyde reductase-like [Argentina anserina]|uniref:phenylacetaldehyde reductase-like n=1 Tax=Argentina anserina TaxID=57926 RepID=UPI002176649E|nr:phenylacetaldehyde reductase-like [Potentilla anserina]